MPKQRGRRPVPRQRERGRRPGREYEDLGRVTDTATATARRLADDHNLRFVDLTNTALAPGAESILPEGVARQSPTRCPMGRRLGTPGHRDRRSRRHRGDGRPAGRPRPRVLRGGRPRRPDRAGHRPPVLARTTGPSGSEPDRPGRRRRPAAGRGQAVHRRAAARVADRGAARPATKPLDRAPAPEVHAAAPASRLSDRPSTARYRLTCRPRTPDVASVPATPADTALAEPETGPARGRRGPAGRAAAPPGLSPSHRRRTARDRPPGWPWREPSPLSRRQPAARPALGRRRAVSRRPRC